MLGNVLKASLISVCCVIYLCIYSISIITSLFTIKQLIFKQYICCSILLYSKLFLLYRNISSNAVAFTYIKCGLNVQILSGPPHTQYTIAYIHTLFIIAQYKLCSHHQILWCETDHLQLMLNAFLSVFDIQCWLIALNILKGLCGLFH